MDIKKGSRNISVNPKLKQSDILAIPLQLLTALRLPCLVQLPLPL